MSFFEAGTYHNLIQDRMLSLAGHLMELGPEAIMRKELHKAGLVPLADTMHWWKACPSDRNNSVLMADPRLVLRTLILEDAHIVPSPLRLW